MEPQQEDTQDASIESYVTEFQEVFRAGSYPQGTFTNDDLDIIVKNYDENFVAAALTFDHDWYGRAYGWVSELKREGDLLLAKFKNVSKQCIELVREKAYTRFSVEIWPELDGRRPYLGAITLLGAAIPQVKGLKSASFSENEQLNTNRFHFQRDNAGIHFVKTVNNKEQLEMSKDKDAVVTADSLKSAMDSLEANIKNFNNDKNSAEAAELKAKYDLLKVQFEAMQVQNDELKTVREQAKQYQDELVSMKKQQKQEEINRFIDDSISNGSLLPAQKESVTAMFSNLNDDETLEKLKTFVGSIKQINVGNSVYNNQSIEGIKDGYYTKSMFEVDNYTVSDERLESLNKIKQFATEKGVGLSEARKMLYTSGVLK